MPSHQPRIATGSPNRPPGVKRERPLFQPPISESQIHYRFVLSRKGEQERFQPERIPFNDVPPAGDDLRHQSRRYRRRPQRVTYHRCQASDARLILRQWPVGFERLFNKLSDVPGSNSPPVNTTITFLAGLTSIRCPPRPQCFVLRRIPFRIYPKSVPVFPAAKV